MKTENDFLKIIRNARSSMNELLEKCWEFGGHTVGEKEFESYDFVKNCRENLQDIEQAINKQINEESKKAG
jgi:hypothetical protein